jgi:thiamine transport system ATP-binding protein
VLGLVGLGGFERREVSSLSGGEQQRVALARALAPQPRLLMLDEPLGSLDRALRQRLLAELAEILRRSGQTSLYVTHDQEEAFALADRIVLLVEGRIAQIGSPQQLYRQPASAFVARFLGLNNLLEGNIIHEGKRAWVETALGRWPAPAGTDAGPVIVLLRPDAVRGEGKAGISLKGRLRKEQFRGSSLWREFEVNGILLGFEFPSQAPAINAGALATLNFDPQEAVQIFPRD